MEEVRSLYSCFNAKVYGDKIKCSKGIKLNNLSLDGSVSIKRLSLGKPLTLFACQKCEYFDDMGPIPEECDRGWVKSDKK